MSIDSLYENVLSILTRMNKIGRVSHELLYINSNDERVLYVYYLMKDLNVFPKVVEVNKTQNVSVYYRNRGNECFQKSQDYIAWQYYNLSLLHAPCFSEHHALALANRSAVFLSLKKFKECLKDINMVLSMQHPEKIRDKLHKRQSACKEALAQKCMQNDVDFDSAKQIEDIFLMKGSRDSVYLCASSKLKVVYTQEMGRHVVATEDINVGEILVQENPYFALLLKHQHLFSCSYCLSRNMNLLPCDSCCFALYCTEECKDKAWKEYHKVECLLMPTLIHMEFTKLELLALRTVIKSRTDHDDWLSLMQTISKAETHIDSRFRGCVRIDNKWVFDSKYYTSIHTLESNIERRSVSDIFQKCVTAAVFLQLLIEATDFMNCDDDTEREKIRRCIAGSLLLHVMTSPTNMHGISSNAANEEGRYVCEMSFASAPYAFHSLINHSCAPNVVRFSKLGSSQMTLFALRPIKKGMQLFDNYGSHHALEPIDKRQDTLRSQYKFTCICEACVNNWPTYLGLHPAKGLPHTIKHRKDTIITRSTILALERGDKGKALEVFKPLCELLTLLEPFAPCMELADCQESLKQCLSIFKGVIPYGYTNAVDWKAIPPNV